MIPGELGQDPAYTYVIDSFSQAVTDDAATYAVTANITKTAKPAVTVTVSYTIDGVEQTGFTVDAYEGKVITAAEVTPADMENYILESATDMTNFVATQDNNTVSFAYVTKSVTVRYFVDGEEVTEEAAMLSGLLLGDTLTLGVQIEGLEAPEGYAYRTTFESVEVTADMSEIVVEYVSEEVFHVEFLYSINGSNYGAMVGGAEAVATVDLAATTDVIEAYKATGEVTVDSKVYTYVGYQEEGKTVSLLYACLADFITVSKEIANGGMPDANGEYTLEFTATAGSLPSISGEGADVVLVIDTSLSMAQGIDYTGSADPMSTTYENSRWAVMMEAVEEYLNTILPNGSSANRVALVTYNESATTAIGFTSDKNAILEKLGTIFNESMYDAAWNGTNPNNANRNAQSDVDNIRQYLPSGTTFALGSGTNIDGGLTVAYNYLNEQSGLEGGYVVLLTDGVANRVYNNNGRTNQADAGPAATAAEESGYRLKNAGSTVYTIAMLNVTLSNNVKKALGDGTYAAAMYHTNDYQHLSEGFSNIASQMVTFPTITTALIMDKLNANFALASGQSFADNGEGFYLLPFAGAITSTPSTVSMKIVANGGITGDSYTNNGCYFNYVATEGGAVMSTAVTDTPIGFILPSAADDAFSTDEDTNINGTVTGNDDVHVTLGGTSLAYVANTTEDEFGTFSISEDGSFTFDPKMEGVATYTYELALTIGTEIYTAEANVVITIAPLYDVTVTYVYASGAPVLFDGASEDVALRLANGADYSVDSPDLTGYTPDQLNVAGVVDGEDVSVEVVYTINEYDITTSVTNGTITDSDTVEFGDDFTVEYAPQEGYELVSVMVDGTDVTASNPDSYTFTEIGDDHNIAVTYQIKTFTITTSVENGVISPNGETTVEYDDDDLLITFGPRTGYHLVSVKVDGESVTASSTTSYTFEDIQASHSIEVVYAINTYTIDTEVVNGSITPDTTVNYGGSTTVRYAPQYGYHLASIEVDEVDVTADYPDSYTFEDIAANHTITVTYVPVDYTIEYYVNGTYFDSNTFDIEDEEIELLVYGVTAPTTVSPWVTEDGAAASALTAVDLIALLAMDETEEESQLAVRLYATTTTPVTPPSDNDSHTITYYYLGSDVAAADNTVFTRFDDFTKYYFFNETVGVPTRDGYTFVGWDQDLTGKQITSDVAVYAVWEEIPAIIPPVVVPPVVIPPVVIEEEEVPLAPELPDEEPVVVVEDDEVPLADTPVEIDDEPVPMIAAYGDCWIHWLILGLTVLYSVYAVLRYMKRDKQIKEITGNVNQK